MHLNHQVIEDDPPQAKSILHQKLLVYLLVMLFGLGTWTNLAGLWIELPLIVPVLPEYWQLPAKLALIINAANVFPILLVFASLIFKLNTAPFEVPVNFILLSTSIVGAICFAFFWDKTAVLFGQEQSISLMLLCFGTAIADCMSSTTFIPFLHRYEPMYLNAYFTGEALTSLLPALIGVAQGIGVSECVIPGDEPWNSTRAEIHYQPRFSVRSYFLILSSLPFSALIAFFILRLIKMGRSPATISKGKSSRHPSRVFIVMENISDLSIIEHTMQAINRIEDQMREAKKRERPSRHRHLKRVIFSEPGIFLCIVFQCSAMLYGACAGLTTFSLNSYSVNTFHYTIIISQFAYPLMTVVGIFIPEVSSKVVYFLYAATVGLFIYIFITAKMSPCPPLVNQTLGHVLIFFVWTIIYVTCSLLRIFMGNYFRHHLGHSGLVWFGMATQIGAFVGALVIFILTNNLELFQERNLCDQTFSCP